MRRWSLPGRRSLRWPRRRTRAAGQILVVAAVAMVLFMTLVGGAVDYGYLLIERQKLQNAVDAASLAGANGLVYAPTPGPTAAVATATRYLSLHGYQDGVDDTAITFTTPATNTLQTSVTREVPMLFWRVFGINQETLSNSATAQWGLNAPVDVILSVDESSNVAANDIGDIRDALTAFVNQLSFGSARGPKIGITQFQGQDCPSTDGVWVWGANDRGQLGNGTTTDSLVPLDVVPINVTGVAAGGSHSIDQLSSGSQPRAWGWGANNAGQVGNGSSGSDVLSPALINTSINITTVAAGGSHSLARTSSGGTPRVYAWGLNDHGQLGTGDTTNRSSPTQVNAGAGLTNLTTVAAGGSHSLALISSGTEPKVYAWGLNSSGQLGNGTTTEQYTPVHVGGSLTSVGGIAGGGNHSLAYTTGGAVWTWGLNDHGQLGLGDTTNRSIPTQISGLTGVTKVAGGRSHSLALKSDGTVWAWGDNTYGQLGDGTTTEQQAPVQVSGLTGTFTGIAAGDYHSLALRSDGTVWAWGRNDRGQLGDTSTSNRSTPYQVGSVSPGYLPTVAQIAAGGSHNLAVAASPCQSEAHVLLELSTSSSNLLKVINGPHTGCPAFPTQPLFSTTPDDNIRCDLKSIGGHSLYIKTGFEVAYRAAGGGFSTWDLWSTAKGGRTTAKNYLVLLADSSNLQGDPDIAGANASTVTAATSLKAGADGISGTSDDVEVFIVGYFASGVSGLTGTTPAGCPAATVPGGVTAVDTMLISASSSTSGSCENYYPQEKGHSTQLISIYAAIASRIARASLIN